MMPLTPGIVGQCLVQHRRDRGIGADQCPHVEVDGVTRHPGWQWPLMSPTVHGILRRLTQKMRQCVDVIALVI